MTENKTQVVVIGGGPGGYAAAFMAADLGLQVTLIDPEENPGGVCLYRGCIPSKALLHIARLIHEARAAEAFGLTFADLKVDRAKLQSWKHDVVAKMTAGLGQLARQKKIVHIHGTALFKDNHTLTIRNGDRKTDELTFEHAIIAAGSRPAQPAALAMDSAHIWNSTGALALSTIPKQLLVIGGGYIGLELGTVYAALGSKVQVVEMTDSLLPGVDKDLVRFVRQRIKENVEQIYLQTTVKELRPQKNGAKVTLDGPDTDGKPQLFDKVLVSVGRRPNSDRLGLENTRMQTDEKGFIRIDDQCRTNETHIFAIGDVAGNPMLAHKATHQGRMAAEVIAGHKAVFEPAGIPAVVFTDPELAWVGLTETRAKEQGITIKAARFPWAASGRAATLGRGDGLTKVIVDPETERILGVGIVGPGAGELIAEGTLAIEMGANVTDMGLTIHPHPTLSETLMEAADVFQGTSTHYHAPKRK